MKDLLIIKNITREGPGLLESLLDDHKLSYDIVDLDKGEALPAFDHLALIVLGGPDSANDQTPKMTGELDLVRRAIEAGTPYLGICLGLQVAVKALGGAIVRSPVKEVGLVDPDGQAFVVELTEAGSQDALFLGLPKVLSVFHLHGETVELTPGMTLLAQGKYCQSQILKLAPKAYGIQSHFELTPEMLGVWAAEDPDLAPLGRGALLEQFKKIEDDYTQIGRTIFTNFLAVAGLI